MSISLILLSITKKSDNIMEEILLYSKKTLLEPFNMPFRIVYYHQELNQAHYHDYYELVVILNGYGKHYTKNKQYPVEQGDVFVIHPGVVHGYCEPVNLSLVNILFDPDKLNFALHDLSDIPGYFALFEAEPKLREKSNFKAKHTLNFKQLTFVDSLLHQIQMEITSMTAGYRLVSTALFQQLIAYIARSYSNNEEKHSSRMVQLSIMLKFIEENFTKNISLEQIAKKSNMSISTANRLFNKLLHETPIKYLIRLRINHAVILLKQGDLSISDVAYRSGFQDSNYFSLQFKKITGVAPARFRKNNLNS